MHCIELCIVCDVLEIKPKVKIHSPVQAKVLHICNLNNLMKIMEQEIIMQNYKICLDSEQNIQFMCLQEKPPLIRISPSFCPEIYIKKEMEF